MLYLTLYKLPLWKSKSITSKLLKVIIISTIIYVLVYYYLNSTYNTNPTLINNKSYVYALMLLDLLATLNFVYRDNKAHNKLLQEEQMKKIHDEQRIKLMKFHKMQQMQELQELYRLQQLNDENKIVDNRDVNSSTDGLPVYESEDNDDIPIYSSN